MFAYCLAAALKIRNCWYAHEKYIHLSNDIFLIKILFYFEKNCEKRCFYFDFCFNFFFQFFLLIKLKIKLNSIYFKNCNSIHSQIIIIFLIKSIPSNFFFQLKAVLDQKYSNREKTRHLNFHHEINGSWVVIWFVSNSCGAISIQMICLI